MFYSIILSIGLALACPVFRSTPAAQPLSTSGTQHSYFLTKSISSLLNIEFDTLTTRHQGIEGRQVSGQLGLMTLSYPYLCNQRACACVRFPLLAHGNKNVGDMLVGQGSHPSAFVLLAPEMGFFFLPTQEA